MNVHVSYKAHKTAEVENHIKSYLEKLQKRLQVFRPDLIHLHVTVDENHSREGVMLTTNLRLPSGQLTSSATGTTPLAAVKSAFEDLQEQLAKHKAKLREKYKRPHARRGARSGPELQVPFEQTIAAVRLPTISRDDITSWVDVNLSRLRRFIRRELRYRENNGLLRPGLVTREEVVDETIANALSDRSDKPERVALEPWLFRLAMRSLDELATRDGEHDSDVSLEADTGEPNVQASDEARLQFHQPDDSLLAHENIADRRTATPEEIAYSDEMISLVEASLLGAKPGDREAFLLYAIEGFSLDEIAVIGERTVEDVRRSILAAREHLRKALPIPNELRDKLLQQTRIA